MSDWDDANILAGVLSIMAAGGTIVVMASNLGEVESGQMIDLGINVVATVAIPSFGLIIGAWLLIKLMSVVEELEGNNRGK